MRIKMREFSPVVEKIKMGNSDLLGFPEYVIVSNGQSSGEIKDSTYIKKYYYPVVHCVKCKYRDEMEFCILNDIFINENDFCSKGIRMDGDEHE